jgi:hypothetical protein
MRLSHRVLAPLAGAVVLAIAMPSAHANPASIDLSGPDGRGTLSISGFKTWAPTLLTPGNPNSGDAVNPPASLIGPNGLPDFPYFYDPNFTRADGGRGVWQSIAAVPLSASTTYAEEATFTVRNKVVNQPNFATFSAGVINYNNGSLTNSGTELIPVSGLSFAFNNNGFSPSMYRGTSADFPRYNDGSGSGNANFRVNLTANNLSGNGLTFINGVLRSIDLTATINLTAGFANSNGTSVAFPWRSGQAINAPAYVYTGQLAISGNQYAFTLDESPDVFTVLTGNTPVDHRLVLNRAGSIAAVTPIPEPGTWAMTLGGVVAIAGIVKRRRRQLA